MPHKDPEKRKEYHRKYKELHKEELALKNAEYRERNQEIIKEKQKQRYYENHQESLNKKLKYREAHRKELAAYSKQYVADHKEHVQEYYKKRISTKEGRANNLVHGYKHADKVKDREFNLSDEWIVDNIFSGQSCIYCGESDWHKLGTDRIDNTKGHTVDNVVPCCMKCNKDRRTKSFFVFAQKFPGSTAMILRNMWAIENAKRLAMSQPLD